jgi:hypothetical protein
MYIFYISSVFYRMRNVSDKSCRENKNTHFMFNNFSFENCAIFEIMWKNTVEPGRPQMTIWHMCIACWIPMATNTLSEYVILICFPLQQWFHKRTSVLHYMYSTCLVMVCFTVQGWFLLPDIVLVQEWKPLHILCRFCDLHNICSHAFICT